MDGDFFKIEYLIGPPVFIFLIFLALLLHEMGHFMLARMLGMPIKSVVIGRGRTLKSWDDRHGSRWSIRLWPLGAYVHLQGGEDGEFFSQPFYKRALTILGGPLINFAILPFLFLGFYLAFGQPSTPAVLVGVEKGYAAEKAGLQPGDRFLAVDGQPVSNYQDMERLAYSKGVAESLYTIQRGEEILDLPFTPGWAEYTDEDGIERKNARFGVTWQHASFALSAIMIVAGQDVSSDENRARELLLKQMGKEVWVGVKNPVGEPSIFKVRLSKDVNRNLANPDHEDYKRVYLGSEPGNIYLDQSFGEHVADALRYSGRFIKNIASIPFQLFPIDPYVISDSNMVTNPEKRIVNIFYKYLHLFAVASVIVGLINLVPLPNLDGGQLLIQSIECWRKSRLNRKQKAKILALTFLMLYLSVLFANLDNVPSYIDSRAKKLQDFIGQATSEE